MKIVINNEKFDYNIGVKLLKSKYGNTPFNGLEDIWEDIVPATFQDIVIQLSNMEQRRVAIGCLGLDKIAKEVNPKLISKETLDKQTTWVTPTGELVTKKFKDTYELYEVSGKSWGEGISNWRTPQDTHFLKFKDTSTDREYMLWVDRTSVARTNNKESWFSWTDTDKVTPIQCIAWSIQTNVPKGGIEKIVRQGDCVLIKKKPNVKLEGVRHLTEEEYRELLVLES